VSSLKRRQKAFLKLMIKTIPLLQQRLFSEINWVEVNKELKRRMPKMKMSVKKFIEKVTLEEGGEISCSVAQVGEVLKIANRMLNGELYKLIRRKKSNCCKHPHGGGEDGHE